jgi:hypothetical protein
MRKLKIADLVLDDTVYPRQEADESHVQVLSDAIEAGVKFPPIVICRKTRRVVDGFHRVLAFGGFFDDQYELDCVEKDYASDRELFLDAIRFNASHGLSLTIADRQLCTLRAKQLGIGDGEAAAALAVTVDRAGRLRANGSSDFVLHVPKPAAPVNATPRRDPNEIKKPIRTPVPAAAQPVTLPNRRCPGCGCKLADITRKADGSPDRCLKCFPLTKDEQLNFERPSEFDELEFDDGVAQRLAEVRAARYADAGPMSHIDALRSQMERGLIDTADVELIAAMQQLCSDLEKFLILAEQY